MTIDFYYLPPSPPCRSVMMLAKHLNIPLEYKFVKLFEGEHLKPEFLAINLVHTIPVIVDHDNKDFTLWESRAIMTYLADKYAPGHDLYPTDATKRAEIDKWLFYDSGSFYPVIRYWIRPAVWSGAPFNPEQEVLVRQKFEELETVMKKQGTKYLASNDNVTIADLAFIASITHAVIPTGMDISMYPTISNWWETLKKELPYYNEINGKAMTDFKAMIAAKQAAFKKA